jgi:hypothetical protein
MPLNLSKCVRTLTGSDTELVIISVARCAAVVPTVPLSV